MDRCEVNNAPEAPFLHSRQGAANAVEGRREVDCNYGVPTVYWKGLDRCNMLDACIIDENVNASEF